MIKLLSVGSFYNNTLAILLQQKSKKTDDHYAYYNYY